MWRDSGGRRGLGCRRLLRRHRKDLEEYDHGRPHSANETCRRDNGGQDRKKSFHHAFSGWACMSAFGHAQAARGTTAYPSDRCRERDADLPRARRHAHGRRDVLTAIAEDSSRPLSWREVLVGLQKSAQVTPAWSSDGTDPHNSSRSDEAGIPQGRGRLRPGLPWHLANYRNARIEWRRIHPPILPVGAHEPVRTSRDGNPFGPSHGVSWNGWPEAHGCFGPNADYRLRPSAVRG